MLGRSDRFVRDRVKSGELPARAHANAKRSSYKISREALLEFMLGQERKGVKEVAEILKGADEYYLRELEEAIMIERKRRLGGRFEIVPHSKQMFKPVLELERKHYPDFQIDEALFEKIAQNPLKLNSTVLDNLTGKAEGHLSLEITSTEFFEALCRGEVAEEYQPPWRRGQTPIIYVDSFILEDPIWAPFLLRNLSRQVMEFCRREGVALHACFAVANDEASTNLLLRYGFAEVAKYQKTHPVMLNRDIARGRLGGYLR